MTIAAWCWVAAFGGFALGWFLCVTLTRDDARRDDEEELLERMFRL